MVRASGVFTILMLMLLLFSLETSTVSADEPDQNGIFTDAGVRQAPFADDETVIRSRLVNVNFDMLGGTSGPALDSSAIGQRLPLNFFGDTTFIGVMDRLEQNASGSYTWIGHLEGIEYSQVILVINGDSMVGEISSPMGLYTIRRFNGDFHAVLEADDSTILSGGGDVDYLIPPDNEIESRVQAPDVADDGSIIDVMVVYTDDLVAASSTADVNNLIDLFMAFTNQAYINSDINQRVALVHTAEVNYNESGRLGTDLDAITDRSDGELDNVHTLRDTYHADLVVLLVCLLYNSNSCSGLAWVQTNVTPNFQASGFSAMKGCSYGSSVFAHELGHNMGSQHDWYQSPSTSPHTYAHGYVDTTNRFRTIMAYNSHCSALGFSCTRINHFSNPNVSYNGAPTGVAGGTSTACGAGQTNPNPDCDADAHRTFNENAANTAGFRSSEIVWTGVTSSDWNTASNWDIQEGVYDALTTVNRVPRSIDNVSIPAGTPNSPLISGSTANARNINIATGATLSMSDGTLNVHGHLEEEGTGQFNGMGGTVALISNLDQTVTLGNGQLFNLQVGNNTTQKITLASNLDINGDLTLNAGIALEAGSSTINVAGNWSDGGNGFVAGTSTVIFDGDTQTADKVTSTTILNEGFDTPTNCCSSARPSGWAREHVDGFGFATGGGLIRRWSDTSDAWLFSKALALQPGLTYEIEYKYAASRGTSDFTLYLGTSQSSSTMLSGTLLHSVSGVSSSSFQTGTATFTVPTTGTYYLGFRNQGSGYGLLDDIILKGIQYISFNNLTINSDVKSTFDENVTVGGNLLVSNGVMDLTTNELTVEGTVTNNAGMQQSRDVSTVGTPYSFLNIMNKAGNNTKYYGVEMTPDGSAGLGNTVVQIDGNQTCTTSVGDSLVKRCFDITPTTSNSATIKYWWLEGERNAQSANAIKVWDYNSGSWAQVGTTATYGETGTSCTADGSCWAEWTGISTFSPMVLGSGNAPLGTPGRGGSSNGVNLASDMEKTGAPSSTVEYNLQVVNTGSVADTFTLAQSGSSWTTLSANSTGSLNPGDTYTVTASVAIPSGEANGATDTATVSATSNTDPAATASVMLTTTVSAPSAGVDLPATQSGSAVVGNNASYSVELVNTGNVPDTFNLTVSGDSWATTVSPDSISELAPGESELIDILVFVPAGAADGATDIANIQATSTYDTNVSDNLVVTTTAIAAAPGVSIASSQVLTGVMGSTVDYTLQVSNTGNISETFTLSVTNNTWDTTVLPSTVTLDVNQQETVTASVKIPVSATNAIVDVGTVYAVSSSTSSISDTVTLTTNGQRLIISPLTTQPAFAGPHSSPSKIDVEVRKPADGLTISDFTVDISGAATIVTFSELANSYKLEVMPPTQSANGLYDLKVEIPEALTMALSDTESSSVQYADSKQVDVMLVLDRSGSMGTTKMDAAKDAAKQFVDYMGTGDMIGVGSFSNNTRVDFNLTEIVSDTKTNAKAAIDPITSGSGTSIGGGLQLGQSELTTRGAAEDAWAIVLLSDGQHNTNPSIESVLPGIADSKTVVHTVGLGSGADEATMLDIASQTGGTYNFAPTSDQLGQVYNTILGAVSNEQLLNSVSGTLNPGATDQIDTTVDASIEEATFSVTWSGTGTIALTLESPSGTSITEAVAAGNANIEYISGPNYAYYRIKSPEVGAWKMFLNDGTTLARRGNAAISYQSQVTADSELTMNFDLEEESYQEGDVIKMIATLSDNQPITGATVVVSVTNPSSVVTTVRLYDDGVHEDGAANDGVYANNFSGATEEGTYQFAVEATGTSNTRSPNASTFNREASASTAVAANPSERLLADLSIVASASPDSVSVGQNVTFEIAVANNGPSDATNVVLTSQLPTGMSYVSSTTGQGTCTHSNGVVACNLGTLSDASIISIVAQATQAGTLSNNMSIVSSDISDLHADNNSTTSSVTVTAAPAPPVSSNQPPQMNQPLPDITVTQGAADQTLNLLDYFSDPNGDLLFFTVVGNSNRTVVLNPLVGQQLDDLMQIKFGEPGQTEITIRAEESVNHLTYQDTFMVTVLAGPAPTLSISKSVSHNSVEAGQQITYTIAVTNSGSGIATNALISDSLPAGLTFVPGSLSTTGMTVGTAGSAPPTLASGVTLAANQTVSLSFAVTVDNSVLANQMITNVADVTSGEVITPVQASNIITVMAPTLAISDVTVAEDVGSALFNVTLSQASASAVTVDFATVAASATITDYTATSGTLTIAAGATEGTITVPILDDDITEEQETFMVQLSNATNAIIADAEAVGIINDNDQDATSVSLATMSAQGTDTTGYISALFALMIISGLVFAIRRKAGQSA